jgi:hypothetical protein
MKRKLGAGLSGLSYIGMIEPGYNQNAFAGRGAAGTAMSG